mgnify:CR=1 FL=1
MKKQDNEGLIQELTKRLDWYMMEASDDEFDAEQVQALMKLLDSLKSEKDKTEELPVEESVSDFWKYCEEREEEEKVLLSAEESAESDGTYNGEEKEEHKESKLRRVFRCFHRHRLVAVAAVVLAVIILGGSWQVVANAGKNGGFFWWMDKSEEGTTMITSPEGNSGDSENFKVERYYSVEDVPEEYRRYVEETFEIEAVSKYMLDFMYIRKDKHNETVAVLMTNNKETIRFEIRIYPQEILRVREQYPGYVFEREFEDEGIIFDVFSREEVSGKHTYLMYFYYGEKKYVVMGRGTESALQDIVIEYKNVVLNDSEGK